MGTYSRIGLGQSYMGTYSRIGLGKRYMGTYSRIGLAQSYMGTYSRIGLLETLCVCKFLRGSCQLYLCFRALLLLKST